MKNQISPTDISNFEAAREVAFDDMEKERVFISRQLETKYALFGTLNLIQDEKINTFSYTTINKLSKQESS